MVYKTVFAYITVTCNHKTWKNSTANLTMRAVFLSSIKKIYSAEVPYCQNSDIR